VKLLWIERAALQLCNVVHISIFYFLQQTTEMLISKNNLVEGLSYCSKFLSLIFALTKSICESFLKISDKLVFNNFAVIQRSLSLHRNLRLTRSSNTSIEGVIKWQIEVRFDIWLLVRLLLYWRHQTLILALSLQLLLNLTNSLVGHLEKVFLSLSRHWVSVIVNSHRFLT
jgi:hypothetical protein